jgi:hypothetical protein
MMDNSVDRANEQALHEHERKLRVIAAMKKYGGSFVQALAAALEVADPNNTARLIRAFPEYMERYSRIVDELDRAATIFSQAEAIRRAVAEHLHPPKDGGA